jgi:hypothetical protein
VRAVLRYRAAWAKGVAKDVDAAALREVMGEPPRAFRPEEVADLQASAGELPAALRAWLERPVHANGPEIFIEGLASFSVNGPPGIVAANQNLREGRQRYPELFARVPPCLVLSYNNTVYVAVELSSGAILGISSDTGAFERREQTLESFLEQLVPLVEEAVGQDWGG